MNKSEAVETVLEKRFGEKNPEMIPNLLEVNTISNEEKSEIALGIGVQLILQGEDNKVIEEYQVNKDGIVFSWGNTPVIDERSHKSEL